MCATCIYAYWLSAPQTPLRSAGAERLVALRARSDPHEAVKLRSAPLRFPLPERSGAHILERYSAKWRAHIGIHITYITYNYIILRIHIERVRRVIEQHWILMMEQIVIFDLHPWFVTLSRNLKDTVLNFIEFEIKPNKLWNITNQTMGEFWDGLRTF